MRLGWRGVRALAIAATVLIALIILILTRTSLAHAVAVRVLAWRGIDSEFVVSRFDLDCAVIEGLSIGSSRAPSLAARRIEVRYSPFGLVRGRITQLTAEGLEIRVTVDEEGARLVGLPLGGGGESSQAGGGVRAPGVVIEDGRFYVDTPAGELVADFSITGDPDAGWHVTAQAYGAQLAHGAAVGDTGSSAFLTLEDATLAVDVTDAAVSADVAVALRELGAGGVRAGAVTVSFGLEGAFADMARLEGLSAVGRFDAHGANIAFDADRAQAVAAMLIPELNGALNSILGPHTDVARRLIAETLADASFDASFTVQAADDRLSFAPDDGVTFMSSNGARVSLMASSDVGGAVILEPRTRAVMARDLLVEVTSGEGFNARLVVAAAGVRPDVNARGARGARGGGDGGGQGRGVAEVSLTAALSPWRVDGVELAGDMSRLRLETDGDDWRLETRADLRLTGAREPDAGDGDDSDDDAGDDAIARLAFRADAVLARLDLETNMADGVLRISPREDAMQELTADHLSVAGISIDGFSGALQPLSALSPLLLMDADGVRFDARLVDASAGLSTGAGRWVALAPAVELAARALDGAERSFSIYAQAPRLEGRLHGPGHEGDDAGEDSGEASGAINVQASVLEASFSVQPEHQARVRFEGLSLSGSALPGRISRAAGEFDVALDDTGQVVSGFAVLTGAEFEDTEERARIEPLTIGGDLRIENAAAVGVFQAINNDGRELARVDVRHAFGEGQGEIAVSTPRFTFTPRGLQPSDISPMLLGVVVEATGVAEAQLRLSWSGAGIVAVAQAELDRLSFDTSFGRVDGLSTQFAIADALGFTTDAPQQVRIASFDPGLPLIDGMVAIELLGGSTLRIADSRFPFAAGELKIEPVEIDWSAREHRVTLLANDIDLSALNELFKPPGLVVSGVLSGAIPVVARDRAVLIVGGELAAAEPGVISYTGRASEGVARQDESTALAFDALKNFQYDTLRLTIDGDVAGWLDVGIHLQGRNPDVYDGFPINFNLTTSAEFASLLASHAFRGVDLNAVRRDALQQADAAEGAEEGP